MGSCRQPAATNQAGSWQREIFMHLLSRRFERLRAGLRLKHFQ
jgi:hypothetical protein